MLNVLNDTKNEYVINEDFLKTEKGWQHERKGKFKVEFNEKESEKKTTSLNEEKMGLEQETRKRDPFERKASE